MSLSRLGRLLQGARQALPLPRMPEKLKGGRLERWADYWVMVGRDYGDVLAGVAEQAKERPGKAAAYASAVAFAVYLISTNPSEIDLRDRLQQHMNSAAMLSEATRSRAVDDSLNHLVECHNTGTIRRLNLILFSLAWEDNHSADCALYRATVSHLKPRYTTFLQERVLDVGFLSRWWLLDRHMENVDVNDDEWDEDGRQRPDHGPKKTENLKFF